MNKIPPYPSPTMAFLIHVRTSLVLPMLMSPPEIFLDPCYATPLGT
jgi:hypothetical protein